MAISAYERQVMLLTLDVIVPEGATTWSAAVFFQVIQRIFDAKGGDAFVSEGLASEAEEQEEDGEEVVSPVLGEPGSADADTIAALAIPDGRVISVDGLMRIADMRTSQNGTVTILLHHADRRASDPALLHLPTGTLRTAGKSEEDGLAHGAHLVIQTAPPGVVKSSQARATLERVPNLGRGSVVTFLNMLVRKVAKVNQLRYTDPTVGKVFRYNPKLGATQPLSASVKSDIESSRINSIDLIKSQPETGLDELGVSAKALTLTLKVDANFPRAGKMALLERIRKKGTTEGYEVMQVRLKAPKASRIMSPRFAMDASDAADTVYARMEPLMGFTNKLEQCPKAVVSEVLDKMHAMFAQPGLWT